MLNHKAKRITKVSQGKFLIVQCARTIGPGHGVSSPALCLERAFKQLGYECERFTLRNIGIRDATPDAGSRGIRTFRFWWNIIAFSTLGAFVIWWRYRWYRRDDVILLCHVDALIGDLFVIRSLHKSFIIQNPLRWLLLIRNPLHLFVLARDAIRYRLGVHKRFIALSQSLAEEATLLYGTDPDQIRVIPNGVDLERFQPSDRARLEVRTELKWDNEVFVLIFVANEFKRKGLDIVLDALYRLFMDGIDCRLIVAGSDSTEPFRTELDRLGDAVYLLGHRFDIERYYAASDLLVLPTAFDISPLVGYEALACGLPLLMTRVGGIPCFLHEGKNGMFIRRSPADVAKKIRYLIENKETLNLMADQARISVKDADWSMIARKYLTVMQEVLAERREEKHRIANFDIGSY